jgi:peptidoglycan hydrolase-like protein with peptidoglycan-binding domain
MKKIATLAVAGLLGLGLATAAEAQQRPMGASGSSMSSGSMSSSHTMPAKPAMKKSASKKSMNMESVKAVQAALNKNGAMLKVDGKMGKATRDALKKYQSSNGLKSTGRMDDATKMKLGV